MLSHSNKQVQCTTMILFFRKSTYKWLSVLVFEHLTETGESILNSTKKNDVSASRCFFFTSFWLYNFLWKSVYASKKMKERKKERSLQAHNCDLIYPSYEFISLDWTLYLETATLFLVTAVSCYNVTKSCRWEMYFMFYVFKFTSHLQIIQLLSRKCFHSSLIMQFK